jgi:hypothetical protein
VLFYWLHRHRTTLRQALSFKREQQSCKGVLFYQGLRGSNSCRDLVSWFGLVVGEQPRLAVTCLKAGLPSRHYRQTNVMRGVRAGLCRIPSAIRCSIELRGRVVPFPLRIPEVSGSNLGPETGYSNWGFSWFCEVLPGKCRDITTWAHDSFLSHWGWLSSGL